MELRALVLGLVAGQPRGRREGDQGGFREVVLVGDEGQAGPLDVPVENELAGLGLAVERSDRTAGLADGDRPNLISPGDLDWTAERLVEVENTQGSLARRVAASLKEPASYLAAPGTASMDPSSPVSLPD